MLKTRLQHPAILAALGEAGHGARVLIADGNYPLATRSNPDAPHVFLNVAAGLVSVTDVLAVLTEAIPVESADVMLPDQGAELPVHREFRTLLPGVPIRAHERSRFYELARGRDVALAIATGESRTFANLLLTIGVVTPEGETNAPPPGPHVAAA